MANPKEQKVAKICILIIFILPFPVGILSVYSKITTSGDDSDKNPNHEFYLDNKLWFYTPDQVLLGTYNCETPNCGYAIGTFDDKNYKINSYEPEDDELTLPLQNIVFLTDNANKENNNIFLYDIANQLPNKTMLFQSVKNYGKGIEDNIYIVENNNKKYGVIQITNQMTPLIPFQYDFIGLTKHFNDSGKIKSDVFVVKQGEYWSLVKRDNSLLTSGITGEIVDYQEKNIIITSDDTYSLVDYQNKSLLETTFKELSYTGPYLNCYTESGEFYIMDIDKNMILGETIQISENDKVRTNMTDNRIEIYVNDSLKNTIVLS